MLGEVHSSQARSLWALAHSIYEKEALMYAHSVKFGRPYRRGTGGV